MILKHYYLEQACSVKQPQSGVIKSENVANIPMPSALMTFHSGRVS